MDFSRLAEELIPAIGGEDNISGFTHCATRLRFTLKDESVPDDEKIKKIQGVLGISRNGGQYQVIIGPEVGKAYDAIQQRISITAEGSSEVPKQKKKVMETIFDFISAVFTPILPAIIGAGLIKSILAIAVLCGIDQSGTTYYFLNFIGDAPLYFLPLMIAFTAAKKLNCNQFLAVAVAGAMIHPSYTALITDQFNLHFTTFLGLPVTLATYSASVVPPILMVIFLHYVEKFCDRFIPKMVIFFFKPVICILVTAIVSFVALGPLGFLIGTAVCNGLNFIGQYAGWLVPTLVGTIAPLMVTTGMHYGLVPFMMQSLASQNYETISGPGMLPSNVAEGGASLALALRTKDSELKKTAFTVGTTAVLGITEPALFGITLKYRSILTCVMIGGGIGGLYAGITGVKCFAFCSPGLLALPTYIGTDGLSNLINAVISMIIGFTAAFILVWVWGYKGTVKAEAAAADGDAAVIDAETAEHTVTKNVTVASPVKGEAIRLQDVPDDTFAQEMLGKGFAVKPADNMVCAPVTGTVLTVFPTKHAIGLKADNGAEVLIHIGIDTVKLNGQYFTSQVETGQHVVLGQPLMACDFRKIEEAGYNTIIPVIITNTADYTEVITEHLGPVEAGTDVLRLK